MVVRYESPVDAVADFVVSLWRRVSAESWRCARCQGVYAYLSERQRGQRDAGQTVTCGGMLPVGRQGCGGRLTQTGGTREL